VLARYCEGDTVKIQAEVEVDEITFWQLVARSVPQRSRVPMQLPTQESAREERPPVAEILVLHRGSVEKT
jgi:hypothetical protein